MHYNPLAPEVQDNPYPYYKELRDKAPVAWIESMQAWAVSRYADVDFALRNPQLFSSASWVSTMQGDLNDPKFPWIIGLDPPDHTRLRKLANKGFTPRLIRALEPRVQTITQELIRAMKRRRECDLVVALSAPLPVTVIAEMLGIETERRADFRRWSDDLVKSSTRPREEAVQTQIRQSGKELRAYFENIIAQRRTAPGDDLISALIQAEEERQMLSSMEVLSLAIFLLHAGNETTTNLISNAVLALLAHPGELTKVRANRTLIPALVEEVLRYDSPVQVVFRRTTQDVALASGAIPADSAVFLLLGAANRDERQFPEPDRFDVARNPQDHVAFGYGIHYCLGAPLARLEGRSALESLLFDCPPFTCTSEHLHRIASLVVRGVHNLPLQFEA
jgi:cytochrome P450